MSENNQFYLVSNQVSVRLYSMQGNKHIGEWQVEGNIINDMDISENGSKILQGFRSGKASIIAWNTVGGNAAKVARKNPIKALRYE